MFFAAIGGDISGPTQAVSPSARRVSIGCGLLKDESAGEEIIKPLYGGPFKRLPPGLHQVYSCFRPSNDNYRAPKPPIFADRLAAASGIYCGNTHTPPHPVAMDFPRGRASSTRMDRGSLLHRTIALPLWRPNSSTSAIMLKRAVIVPSITSLSNSSSLVRTRAENDRNHTGTLPPRLFGSYRVWFLLCP